MMKKLSSLNRNSLGVMGLLLAIVLFVCVNIISAFALKSYRLDLTQAKLYSLSDGSLKAIEQIKEPITIRFYLSEKLAQVSQAHAAYAIRVIELLEQYSSASDGKVKIEIVNPAPFSHQEDEALTYGLKGIPVGNSSEYVYIGMTITNASDRQRVIALLDPSRERFLEYDITKYLADMTRAKRPIIGIISNLPIDGRGEPHLVYPKYHPRWAIMKQIREVFDVRFISRKTLNIPREIDALMLVNPKTFGEETLYEIDQYVMRGGNLLVLIDPFSEIEFKLGETPYSVRPDLEKLFEKWGVAFNPLSLVADMTLARSSTMTENGKSVQKKFPLWLGLNEDYLSPEDPITGTIASLNLSFSGYFDITKKVEDLIPTPLIFSSKETQLLPSRIGVSPDPVAIQNSFQSSNKNRILGLRLKGKPESAFKEAPKRYFLKKRTEEHLLKAKEIVNIVLIADSDILADGLWTTKSKILGVEQVYPFAGNADLIVNALDNLSGTASLINLRSKSQWRRPFQVLEEMSLKAARQYQKQETLLQRDLYLAQQRLEALSNKSSAKDENILSQKDKEELQTIRKQILSLRVALRSVQTVLTQEIVALRSMIMLFNILFVPFLLMIIGLFFIWRRRSKRVLTRKE